MATPRIKVSVVSVYPNNPYDSVLGRRYELKQGACTATLETYPHDDLDVVAVSTIEVSPESCQRTGLGTKLYERAAKDACKLDRKPLASDTIRSRAAGGFWEKQRRKGRASLLEDAGDDDVDGGTRFVLMCPAPTSLAGRRNRRKVRR